MIKAGIFRNRPVFTPTPGEPNGVNDDANAVISLDKRFWQIFPDTIAKFGITNYFWNTNIPMFANIGKDDLMGKLRAYVDANGNLAAADVREVY